MTSIRRVAVAAELGAYGGARHYDFVLDLLLRGLCNATGAEPDGRTARR